MEKELIFISLCVLNSSEEQSMAFVEKVPFPLRELRKILRDRGLPIPAGYWKLLEYLAENGNEPVPTGDAAQLLYELVKEGLLRGNHRSSSWSIVERALSVINGVAVNAKSPMRISYTDKNHHFIRVHLQRGKKSRAPAKVDGVTIETRRANVAHGLKGCRQFGCAIGCKDVCEFALALKALGGDPMHYGVTPREDVREFLRSLGPEKKYFTGPTPAELLSEPTGPPTKEERPTSGEKM